MGSSDSDTRERRIDLYLSGGGYRAALGALGVMYFLAFDGRWADVRRIVSVSGGSIVNAQLALARPPTSEVPRELGRLFRMLTSRRNSYRALWPAVAVFYAGVAPVVALAWELSESVAVTVLVALVWLPIVLFYAVRLWLWRLYRGVVGGARLDDLADREWTIEHVVVATDLSEHGSVFFLANAIQPQVASLPRGYFDARDVTFRKALRASTALPPILPPTRLRLKSTPGRPDSRLAGREYLWKPSREDDSLKAWLADGGVTGNLGIQLDATLAPDNPTLLEIVSAGTLAGTPAAPRTPYTCRWHDYEIAWNCLKCQRETVVVDASGVTAPQKRLAEIGLGTPPLSLPVFAVRSLQVMYKSSLADDQAHAGDAVVGVVSTEQMINRIVMKNFMGDRSKDRSEDPSEGSIQRMVRAGEAEGYRRNLATPEFQGPLGMSDLMRACYAARTAASKVPTRLSAVSAPVAARVVASGYLNACLNTHGPAAFDKAEQGIRQLAALLGPDAALGGWWEDVNRDISAGR